MAIRYLQDIIVEVGSLKYSSDKFDMSVSITENEDNPRRAVISIFNISPENEAEFSKIGNRITVSIYWYSLNKADVLYVGTTNDFYKNRVNADERFEILSDDGYTDTLNSYTLTNTNSSSSMISNIKDILVKNGGVKLGEYPDSLNKPHPSNRSYTFKGSVETTIRQYLGSNYRVTYDGGTLKIFEKKTGYRTVYSLSTKSLYDYPMRRVKRKNKDSQDLENNRKNYLIKSIPYSFFKIGNRLKITDSDYIDDSEYIITSVDIQLDKLKSVAGLVVSEVGKTKLEG